jgi:hypothetical protein
MTLIPHKVRNYTPEFLSWFEGVKKITNDYFDLNFPNNPKPSFEFKMGPRYVKIIRDRSVHAFIRDRSVHAFIDCINGDVLKPTSWRAPAKHSRGNIFDTKNGLGSMEVFGPAYLR